MRHDFPGEVKLLPETTALSLTEFINQLKSCREKTTFALGTEKNSKKRRGYNIFTPFRAATHRQVIISCRIMSAEDFCAPEIQNTSFSIHD